jgi:hypothetical protein
MTPKQKNAIIKLCKQHALNEGNCRIGWACEQILGKAQQNHVHQKLSAIVIRDKRFSRQPSTKFDNDYDVFLIKSYKEIFLGKLADYIIPALLALITGYTLWRIDNQSKLQEREQLKDRIEKVESKLNDLQKKSASNK